jgi:hypothetical protein
MQYYIYDYHREININDPQNENTYIKLRLSQFETPTP